MTQNLCSLISAPSPRGRECPFLGRYEISGGLNAEDVGKALAASQPGSENGQDKPTPCNPPGKQYLTVGCNSADTMEFQSECGTKTVAGKRRSAETLSWFLIHFIRCRSCSTNNKIPITMDEIQK